MTHMARAVAIAGTQSCPFLPPQHCCRSERPASKGTDVKCRCVFAAALCLHLFLSCISCRLGEAARRSGRGGAVGTPSTKGGLWAQCPTGKGCHRLGVTVCMAGRAIVPHPHFRGVCKAVKGAGMSRCGESGIKQKRGHGWGPGVGQPAWRGER